MRPYVSVPILSIEVRVNKKMKLVLKNLLAV